MVNIFDKLFRRGSAVQPEKPLRSPVCEYVNADGTSTVLNLNGIAYPYRFDFGTLRINDESLHYTPTGTHQKYFDSGWEMRAVTGDKHPEFSNSTEIPSDGVDIKLTPGMKIFPSTKPGIYLRFYMK